MTTSTIGSDRMNTHVNAFSINLQFTYEGVLLRANFFRFQKMNISERLSLIKKGIQVKQYDVQRAKNMY